jgi:hypothetical protein
MNVPVQSESILSKISEPDSSALYIGITVSMDKLQPEMQTSLGFFLDYTWIYI